MSDTFNLQSMREELDNEYAPLEINIGGNETVVLRPLLRLGEREQKTVIEKLQTIEGNEDSVDISAFASVAKAVLKTVAKSKGDKLVSAIGDDLVLAVRVLNEWREQTQPGEASDSSD